MKRKVQDDIGWQILLAKSRNDLEPVKEPAMFAFEWHEKTFRRDKDNVASAKKFIFDALQETGILRGDGNKFVLGFTDTFVHDDRDGVIVTITTPSDRV